MNGNLPNPTQEQRVLDVLLGARGKWINGRYFLKEMFLSQYHRALWNLEHRDGHEIEHSKFKDNFGFVSYRIVPEEPPQEVERRQTNLL